MWRFFKELYLAEFLCFFKLADEFWPHAVNIGKGVAGVTLIEFFFLAGIEWRAETIFGKQFAFDFACWAIVLSYLLLWLANYHFLVNRGEGIAFERKFRNFGRNRKLVLIASCVVVVAIALAFGILSALAYRDHFYGS